MQSCWWQVSLALHAAQPHPDSGFKAARFPRSFEWPVMWPPTPRPGARNTLRGARRRSNGASLPSKAQLHSILRPSPEQSARGRSRGKRHLLPGTGQNRVRSALIHARELQNASHTAQLSMYGTKAASPSRRSSHAPPETSRMPARRAVSLPREILERVPANKRANHSAPRYEPCAALRQAHAQHAGSLRGQRERKLAVRRVRTAA